MSKNQFISLEEIQSAQKIIAGKLHRTPILRSSYLGSLLNLQLSFKCENFQKTGSFKPRGVLNKLAHLTDEEKNKGVISLSAGNHAQALAWAATESGIASTIVMPATSVRNKIEATKGYGGEVVLTEGPLLDRCLELQKERALTLVHPFDDLHIIAGQGTVGLEFLEESNDIDGVVVGIGGGGLISGIATAVKLKSLRTKVIGVEPEGAAVMSESLQQGTAVNLKKLQTIADGLAAPFAGEHTLIHVQRYVDEVVTVADEEIIDAMRLLMTRCKVVVEPAGAASLAALLAGKVKFSPGEKVVCVLSGGNIDVERLKTLF